MKSVKQRECEMNGRDIKWAKYYRICFQWNGFLGIATIGTIPIAFLRTWLSARVDIRFFKIRLHFDFHWKIYSIICDDTHHFEYMIPERTYIALHFLHCNQMWFPGNEAILRINSSTQTHASIYLVGCLIYKMSTWFFFQSHKFNICIWISTHAHTQTNSREKFPFGRHEMKA